VEILDFMFARFDPEEVELFAEIARRLWFRRNDVVHGGNFSHPNEVIGTATALMTEYRSDLIPVHVEREPLNGSVEPLMVKWSSPPVGVVKANWDVAVDMKNGKLGYGCVIRDFSGNLQAASCHVEFLMADPVVGEALAALHTMEFCRDNGFSSIVLEGDSLLIQAIDNTGVNWNMIGFIIDDIRIILKRFMWWRICHTK
jgi:hypothetical protein